MDSLLANYASSDEEEDVQKKPAASPPPKPTLKSAGLPPSKPSSLSLPPPKPSSSLLQPRIFSSLPPPKSQNPPLNRPIPSYLKTHDPNAEDESEVEKRRKPTKDFSSSTPSKAPSSIFSSLPPPKTATSSSSSALFSSLPPPKSKPPKPANSSSLDPKPKRVVQVTLPLHPSLIKSHDPDDDDDDEEDKGRKPGKDLLTSTSSTALSTMLPAPKNSLCLAPGPSSAASRRSVVEANVPAAKPGGLIPEKEMNGYEDYADVPAANSGGFRPEQEPYGYENHESYNGGWAGGFVEDGVEGVSDLGFAGGDEASASVQSYGSGEDYGSYERNWSDASVAMTVPEVPDMSRIMGKRGRNEIPTEIVEVKQDELIKNRPREDQVKMTGIAFGPAYQPVSSSKGKPTKLHKRKHQIGSLFFEMKQKEMELAERRSRGFLTKAETQAKYGW